jgi:hypothetical protein
MYIQYYILPYVDYCSRIAELRLRSNALISRSAFIISLKIEAVTVPSL